MAVSAMLELPEIEDQTAFNFERWEALLEGPIMMPFQGRIEIEAFGHAVMSGPPAYDHGGYQFMLGRTIERYKRKGVFRPRLRSLLLKV